MKRCLKCNTLFATFTNKCPSCGSTPSLVDGFEAYEPKLAHGSNGFKKSYFSELSRLEDANFWFRARNKLILWAINVYQPNFESFLEVGCGTGYVLSGISKLFPHAKLYGSEIFTAGLDFAASRIPSANLMQMDARQIPFSEEFDVIGAFDVLEHISEDVKVLMQIREALKPDGLILITVPQHNWLWSSSDDYACHVRRYNSMELHKKLTTAGFSILRSTSFVSFLLPAMALSRFKNRSKKGTFKPTEELKMPWILNYFFLLSMRAEIALIKSGLSFPLGGSRLVVARKVK